MPTADTKLIIRNALIDNYNRYALGVDTKDWGMVRACFADRVFLDYAGLGASSTDSADGRDADEWIDTLQSVINGFDITRHAITNHRVTIFDQVVSCSAYLSADHVIFSAPEVPYVGDQDVVSVVGEYTNFYEQIEGDWKICKSQLIVNWTSGNTDLLATAMARVAAR
ncbi:MAG: nuclear transport factor 2 family protein [Halioglobus sp.]